MIHRVRSAGLLGLFMLSMLAATGCNTTYGPRFGLWGYPIPVSPYFQYQLEDKAWERERYKRRCRSSTRWCPGAANGLG